MALDSLMAQLLPLNRKEKYYTGTVLPGIICADNFAHFSHFTRLLPEQPVFELASDLVTIVSSAEATVGPAEKVTKLASKSKMAGAEIMRQQGKGVLWYKTVGRNRGLYGPEFAGDVQSGRWRTHNYEVSTSDIPENRNWFTVDDFVRSIGKDA